MGYRTLFWLALAYVIWRVYQDLFNKLRSSSRSNPNTIKTPVDEVEPPAWACECLGVEPHTPQKAVKLAYQNLVKQYHPDRMEGMGAELRELAESRTKEINRAYLEFKKRWEHNQTEHK